MEKTKLRKSTLISTVLTVALLGGLTVLAVALPWILRGYIEKFAYANTAVALARFGVLLALCYTVLIPAFSAGGLMLWLLHRVRRGMIFVAPSATVIQLIAICCFAECAIFGLLTMYFHLAPAVAFCALFLGIALWVVSDVVREGTEIKTENDFTV